MFSDKRCEIKCVFPYVVGIRTMSLHISCDLYLCLGLHVQIRLYYVLPYKPKISAQHEMAFILDRCIVYLGLTMPNWQKKRLLIFEIFNMKKRTLFFGTEKSYFRFNNFGPVLSILFYYHWSPLFLGLLPPTHMPQRRRQAPISKAPSGRGSGRK